MHLKGGWLLIQVLGCSLTSEPKPIIPPPRKYILPAIDLLKDNIHYNSIINWAYGRASIINLVRDELGGTTSSINRAI